MSLENLNSKQKILNCAKELFASKGYRATTIRDISSEAKLNSSLISYHFKGKEGLLIELVSQLYSTELPRLMDILNAPVASIDELRVRLEIFMDSILRVGIENWELVKIILSETYELSKIEELNAQSFSFLQILNDFFVEAQRNKILKSEVSTFVLADSLYAVTMDQISNWKLNTEHMDFDISQREVRLKWISEILLILLSGAKA